LETAIFERISAIHPEASLSVAKLRVLSREYTGVGRFTNFRLKQPGEERIQSTLELPGVIHVAGVSNGLGAF
jgi:hypothetical protein